MKPDTILVSDFGGQYTHLISRRIRENNVYSKMVPYDITKKEIQTLMKHHNIKGIILSGGPLSVYEENAPKLNSEILKLNQPILGLCYGHQLIAKTYGGKVLSSKKESMEQPT